MNPSPAVSIAAVTNTPATTQGIQQALSKVAAKCTSASRSLTPFGRLRDFILKKVEEAKTAMGMMTAPLNTLPLTPRNTLN